MSHEGDGFVLADAFSNSEFIEVSLEVSIFAKLQDNIKALSTAETVMHFDDKGRRYGLESRDLTFDLFLDMVGEFVDVNNFDCHFHAILALSVEYCSTGSLTEGLGGPDSIIGDLLNS